MAGGRLKYIKNNTPKVYKNNYLVGPFKNVYKGNRRTQSLTNLGFDANANNAKTLRAAAPFVKGLYLMQ